MSRASLFPLIVLGLGLAGILAGSAMELLRWHHTLGYAGLGGGALLAIAGGALVSARRPSGRMGQVFSKLQSAGRALNGRRTRGIVVAAVIVGATLGTFLYAESRLTAQSGSPFALSLNVASASEVTYANGSVSVAVYVTAVGAAPPYTFTVVWGDHTDQTSTTGNFTRLFGANVPIATVLTITGKSADSALGSLTLTLPSEVPVANGEVSTRTLEVVTTTSAQGGAVVSQSSQANPFVAVVNASVPTPSSRGFQSSQSSTSLITGTTTFTTSSQASATSQKWDFVLASPPNVVVEQGVPYLDVNYTNTLGVPATVYVSTVVTPTGGSGSHVPGAVVSVAPGGLLQLYSDLGNLSPGSYSAYFYVANSSTGQQVSESAIIQFTVG